jgi:hypothetical protein
MEELLGGALAQKAKALCAGLEDAGCTTAAAAAVLGKPPEDDFGRALQRVARSTGACDVVSRGTYGNTLVTLRKGAEDGMEALAHRSDFGKVPPSAALVRSAPNCAVLSSGAASCLGLGVCAKSAVSGTIGASPGTLNPQGTVTCVVPFHIYPPVLASCLISKSNVKMSQMAQDS